jgi:hypothetical protein
MALVLESSDHVRNGGDPRQHLTYRQIHPDLPNPTVDYGIRILRKTLAGKEKLCLVDNAGAQSGTDLALTPTWWSHTELGTLMAPPIPFL